MSTTGPTTKEEERMSKSKRFRVPSSQDSEPSKKAFAQMLIGGMRSAGVSGDIPYDAEEYCLRDASGEPLDLEIAYREYCSTASQFRAGVLQHWVSALCGLTKQMPENFEDARPSLLPLVVERVFHDVDTLRTGLGGGEASDWPFQPIGEHLAVGLVHDMPKASPWIRQGTLNKWGVTFGDAMTIATENLKQLPYSITGPESGVYVFANRDDYDASRLLLLDVIRQLPLQGDPIAVAPRGTR